MEGNNHSIRKECQQFQVRMEGRMTAVETMITEIKDNHLPHISDELKVIRQKLDRPAWSTTVIVSLLSCAVVGLLVAIVK